MFALAQGARQYNLVRPRLSEENIIDVENCRHLLQEMTVPSYVANDAFLVGGSGSDHENDHDNQERSTSLPADAASTAPDRESQGPPSTLLLTGPNYSGKSIYLKSIAQTLYLSHLGSFVPASRATIGLTDAILTRIRTCETVSRPHSAFMIDLQQVAGILKQASRRSLVVIDEFGKGTDGADGAGLAAGVFQHLLGRGEVGDAPKVLAATHFHEIFEMGFLRQQRGLGLAHMEVRVDRNGTGRDGAEEGEGAGAAGLGTQVTHLYNLRPGRSGESFGTQCAALNGVPAPIVERASRLSQLAVQGEDLVSICAGVGREEEGDLKRAEAVARRFLEWDLDAVVEEEDPRRLLEELIGDGGSGSDVGTGRGTETQTGLETRSGTMSRGLS